MFSVTWRETETTGEATKPGGGAGSEQTRTATEQQDRWIEKNAPAKPSRGLVLRIIQAIRQK